MPSKKAAARLMIVFANRNKFLVNPLIGADYFAKNYIGAGHCICDDNRKKCPCPESLAEVPERGKCKCGLYWLSYDHWLRYDPLQPEKSIMQEEEKESGH